MEEQFDDHRNGNAGQSHSQESQSGRERVLDRTPDHSVTATMSTAHKNGALFLLHQIAKLMTAFYAQTVVKSMYKGQQLVTSRVERTVTITPSADEETRRRGAEMQLPGDRRKVERWRAPPRLC